MKRVIWATSARADLGAIDDYYHEIALAYAAQIGQLAIEAGQFLAGTPYAGAKLDELGMRKWRITKTPYIDRSNRV